MNILIRYFVKLSFFRVSLSLLRMPQKIQLQQKLMTAAAFINLLKLMPLLELKRENDLNNWRIYPVISVPINRIAMLNSNYTWTQNTWELFIHVINAILFPPRAIILGDTRKWNIVSNMYIISYSIFILANVFNSSYAKLNKESNTLYIAVFRIRVILIRIRMDPDPNSNLFFLNFFCIRFKTHNDVFLL